MVVCGLLLRASIAWDWLVTGVIVVFFVAAHVVWLLQFTDSGYKGLYMYERAADG